VHNERRTTIVLVAHHVEFVLGLATRMTVLEAGRVLAEGEPGDVLGRPEVVDAFLGSVHEEEEVIDHARS
jgi:ABC-type branched-subunit amino acid transport system ATPase component